MSKKQKLELTWIGKENRPKLEPRILLEDPAKSYHAKHRVTDGDLFDNQLIFGDNLLALKALEAEFAGKVKCIYIDPPYNTGQAFDHYDDGLEHSIWLGLMRERFEVLRRLLTPDGTFFCQLNDDEMAYGKVLLDEVFGRRNCLNQVSVKMKQTAGASGGGEDKRLKKNIEYILIYARDKDGEVDYEVVVSKGYVELKPSAYTYSVNEPTADYRVSPDDKSNMSKYVFGGFKNCLYPVQKFASEAERVLAVILERDAQKWFKPAKGQFLIFYKQAADHPEYQPDFVAESKDAIYMLEPKASNQMDDVIVQAKKEAAIRWCKNATDYALANGGKPWRYVLIPHNAIAVNMTLDGLAGQFSV